MGNLKQRKRRLMIRKIKDTMEYANKECHGQIIQLNRPAKICSCPGCKSPEHVKYTGTNRGIRKFCCNNLDHKTKVWFSTSTSYEAMEIYRNKLVENLCLLTKTNAAINDIQDYNETSRYFVELALEGLYEFIITSANKSVITIEDKTELVAIFLDISGSGLAKNKAIILARVDGKTIFEVVTCSNHLSTHKILAVIKERLHISSKIKLVFVTDGEACFVDPIKHYFPDAIHIRQFHKASCKGIIHVHLNYEGQEYTIRTLWDTVLNEGKPSQKVIEQRERKAKKRLNKKETVKKIRYSQLSKDVFLWKGTIYEPRGVRRIIRNQETKKKSEKKTTSKKKYTSPHDIQLISKGTLKEMKQQPIIAYCFEILKKIFGGLYITSNIVETIFNFKSKLYPHRTMKFGDRLLVTILYCCLVLKGKTKQELTKFLQEEVITYDFIMQKVLYGSGKQKNKVKPPCFLDKIKNAIANNQQLVIHYCDRYRKHTSRIITPLTINHNDYNNTTQIEANCHLRNEKRNFYLERMRDLEIYDPGGLCF